MSECLFVLNVGDEAGFLAVGEALHEVDHPQVDVLPVVEGLLFVEGGAHAKLVIFGWSLELEGFGFGGLNAFGGHFIGDPVKIDNGELVDELQVRFFHQLFCL